MTVLIPNLAIAGYRSFGKQPQYFERFAKINIFIGQNNAGKSNVLRFLHEIYPQASGREPLKLDSLARHLPSQPPILLGIGEYLDRTDPAHPKLLNDHRLMAGRENEHQKVIAGTALGKLFSEKCRIDQTSLCWTLLTLPDRKDQQESWSKAAKVLQDHEVIILASAATVLQDYVVCIEEPELHLNPILQKKLLRYLARHTRNQYFITTHSAALMDTPGAEIYHVRLKDGASTVERATSNEHRSAVCEDLGYHPSDLLQANCVIWVEGPSDRIYLNWWLRSVDPALVEGIHYSVMFYGGRLAAHLTQAPNSPEISDFISLRRLNRRGVMIIDSDRDKPHAPINATKRRLQEEFDSGPGHAWITDGREIENYLQSSQVTTAISAIHPKAVQIAGTGKHANLLRIKSGKGKETMASKAEVAKYVAANFEPDFGALDLRRRVTSLRKFILDSNPKTGPVGASAA